MRDETLAIHGGYTPDSTRAVAVPIYQTVAHDFIDADHAGAIMDLETRGFHYNRINNPTVDVLEQRMAALEGGVAAMAVSSGATAVSMSLLNLLSAGDNFVSVPTLYGATYTYFAHVLPRLGIEVRFSADDHPESIAARIDERTKAVFCETVGNPAGNIIDLAAVAEVAHARGVPIIADNTVATPLLLKPFAARGRRRDPLADEVHRRPRHDARRHHHRRRHLPVGRSPGALRPDGRAGAGVSRRAIRDRLPRRARTSRAAGRSACAIRARRCLPSTPSCSCRASRPWLCACRATSPTRGPWRSFWLRIRV